MFNIVRDKVLSTFEGMKNDTLFLVNSEEMFETYLENLPPEKRQEHNCNCCKSFFKHYGGIVTVDDDGKRSSIWDFEIDGIYSDAVIRLREIAHQYPIYSVLLSKEKWLGTPKSYVLKEGIGITWTHFNVSNPRVIRSGLSLDKLKGNFKSTVDVFHRGLREISLDALDIVLDLIQQKSLYRGAEFENSVKQFRILSQNWDGNLDYVWKHSSEPSARIRNTSIGTLLLDLSEGKSLDRSVEAFEKIVAPSNYKRPTASISVGMVKEAEKTIQELGIEESLSRKFATYDDMDINNFLYIHKQKKTLGSMLMSEVTPKLSKVDNISISDFTKNVLPNTEKIELLFEHPNNLVSLIAPTHGPNIFKWDNGFSWDYTGNNADYIKQRVKEEGGKVEGAFRISLAWYNHDDLDLHVIEPTGRHIYFGSKSSPSSGYLDVDMNVTHLSRTPVENVIYRECPPKGTYKVYVQNFCKREIIDAGFSVEIEHQGKRYLYKSDVSPENSHNITVVEFDFDKEMQNIKTKLGGGEVWGMSLNTFQPVSSIMYSPNYWGNNSIGNKHLFFMLDSAVNPKEARGLYNEMLDNKFNEHRKVFEVLGKKLLVPHTTPQVSGVGFSMTQSNEAIVRVHHNFNRVLKIQF